MSTADGAGGGLDVVRARLLGLTQRRKLRPPFVMERLWFAERSSEEGGGTSEGGWVSFGCSLINTTGGSCDRPSFTAVT